MTGQEARVQLIPMPALARRTEVTSEDITIGRDVLELITAAMYVDPLSIFREYIQNAVDAIDEARDLNLFRPDEQPTVEITLSPDLRTVRVRDNGASIAAQEFARRLLAIGASPKRGRHLRGFRGIGRLAGLGYCQELVFRGRAEGERGVVEVSWDARRLREALRGELGDDDLASTIQQIARVTRLPGDSWPRRFFEVELRKVVRIKNDMLLNPDVVADYIAEAAPAPFAKEFAFGERIDDFLRRHRLRPAINVTVNGGSPIERPHLSSFDITPKLRDTFNDVAFVEFPGVEGGIDAAGWVLDHGYYGSLPKRLRIGGLRVRSGDIQVGGNDILAELFVEPRFNGWAVGELHILNPQIVPNGRRDQFEYNVHYANFQAHVTRLASELTRTCRSRSDARRITRTLNEQVAMYERDLPLIRSIPEELAFRSRQLDAMEAGLARCERRIKRLQVAGSHQEELEKRLRALAQRIGRARVESGSRKFLKRLPTAKRRVYAEVLSGIYETLGDLERAHETVLRLLKRASAGRRRA